MSTRDVTRKELLDASREAALRAYCPYSNFRVGAAALANGDIFTGVNIENASYSLTICAERSAIAKAVSEGKRHVQALAVTSLDAIEGAIPPRMPCGACLQVIAEFVIPDGYIYVDGVGDFRLMELLPKPFGR